jgi:phosphoribosylglycinamide formyltransferase-1
MSGIVILISGRGSNMQAILEAVNAGEIPAEVRAVISSKPDAAGLKFAEDAGVATEVIDHRKFSARADFEHALATTIENYAPRLVVLAGFMRILTPEFVRRFENRLINIHPSLLPQFQGLNTHQRALDAGAKQHGASVHFVIPAVDAGPIIIQAAVPVLSGDTADILAARVLEQEHRIFPLAVKWFMEGRLSIREGKVLLDGAVRAEQGLVG